MVTSNTSSIVRRVKFDKNPMPRRMFVTLICFMLSFGVAGGSAYGQGKLTEQFLQFVDDIKHGQFNILTPDDIACYSDIGDCIKRGLCGAYSFDFCDSQVLLRSIISARRLNNLYLFQYSPSNDNDEYVVVYNSTAKRVVVIDQLTFAGIQKVASYLKKNEGWSPEKITNTILPSQEYTGRLFGVGQCVRYESSLALVNLHYSAPNSFSIDLINKVSYNAQQERDAKALILRVPQTRTPCGDDQNYVYFSKTSRF